YVTALLRHDGAQEAESWLARLEQAPDSPLTLEARCRLLAAKGQGAAAGRLLTQFAHKESESRKEPTPLLAAAGLLEELKQPQEAEQLYREYATAVEPKRPESALTLALFLARQNRVSDALDFCYRTSAKCPPEVIGRVGAGVLRLGRPAPGDFRRVESW